MPHGPVMYITICSRRAALWDGPYAGPGRGVFYELRVTRSDVVSLSLLPRSGIRRGRPESLFGPPGTDQREVQGGCQNGQRWLASRCGNSVKCYAEKTPFAGRSQQAVHRTAFVGDVLSRRPATR